MSNVIQFLETLGSKPALSAADYAATVATLGVGATQQQALLNRDEAKLMNLLGGRSKMLFAIIPPDNDAPEGAA